MSKFILRALSGPLKGKAFPLRKRLRIGRSKGEILLRDRLVSDLHAEIVFSGKKFVITDCGSKNKIFIEGKRLEKASLQIGSRFKIGLTEFELGTQKSPEQIWMDFMKGCIDSMEDRPIRLEPFSKTLRLECVSGMERGKEFLLLYGPRFFGSGSVEFPLFDESVPKKAFAFVPEGQEILFLSSHPDQVRLNNQKVSKTQLKDGDEISIEDSLFKVNLEESNKA